MLKKNNNKHTPYVNKYYCFYEMYNPSEMRLKKYREEFWTFTVFSSREVIS